MTETNAVPISPLSARIGSVESGSTARSRRCRPAAKTSSSTAPTAVNVWKAYIAPVWSWSFARIAAGSPAMSLS